MYYFNNICCAPNFALKELKMKNVFIINGGHAFAHSPGKFNETLLQESIQHFKEIGFEVKFTKVGEEYDLKEEVEKFKWADLIIYHTPIWWFQLPFRFKEYIDRVFTEGHENGIYMSDGRSRKNPAINYGTAGSLKGKPYILTTSWNAPKEAFEREGEFFEQRSVDDGAMFGFHKMNQFADMKKLASIHFHDIEKNADVPKELKRYKAFLNDLFEE